MICSLFVEVQIYLSGLKKQTISIEEDIALIVKISDCSIYPLVSGFVM